jgi:putative nucleotidyltransferase with HDIG domain
LEFAAGRGFHSKAIEHSRVRLGEGQAGKVALERRVVQIPDIVASGAVFAQVKLFTEEKVAAYFAVPLIAKGQVKGVLEIFQRAPFQPDKEWLDFLNTLAGQAAIAIDNATLFKSLQRSNTDLSLAYNATIEGWSRALDLRDKETEGHTQRVMEISVKLSRESGLSEADLVQVRWGALLHDIGKMGVPDAILLKPGPLTDEEWKVMRMHPQFAYDMLAPIAYLRSAIDIPYCHHEKWDGTGYPRGLKGDLIPLTARIFAVVDVWDALRSDRPYRKGWSDEKAREHIRSLAGTHFDPKAVEVFLKVMNENA